jgi:uracil-DNA glycosylase
MGQIKLFDSYHCSRLNTNTGVLTPKMFGDVIAKIRADLDAAAPAAASPRADAR